MLNRKIVFKDTQHVLRVTTVVGKVGTRRGIVPISYLLASIPNNNNQIEPLEFE